MSVRAHAIFPILIPTLIKVPISAFNAQALASLVTVAGNALNRRLSQILDALQKSAESEEDDETKETLNAAVRAVLASVHDTEGLHMLMIHLLGLAKDPRGSKRAGGCNLFASFCEVTEEDFSSYHIDWYVQRATDIAIQPCGTFADITRYTGCAKSCLFSMIVMPLLWKRRAEPWTPSQRRSQRNKWKVYLLRYAEQLRV